VAAARILEGVRVASGTEVRVVRDLSRGWEVEVETKQISHGHRVDPVELRFGERVNLERILEPEPVAIPNTLVGVGNNPAHGGREGCALHVGLK